MGNVVCLKDFSARRGAEKVQSGCVTGLRYFKQGTHLTIDNGDGKMTYEWVNGWLPQDEYGVGTKVRFQVCPKEAQRQRGSGLYKTLDRVEILPEDVSPSSSVTKTHLIPFPQ